MLRAAFIIGALTALAPLAAQAQSWQYRCPAPGTVVERSDGSRIAYRGADPSDPLVCLTTTGQRLVFGNWNAASPGGSLPMTLRMAREVGPIMAEVPDHDDPDLSYRYYM